MAKGPLFIERGVFEQILGDIQTADGSSYQDIRTIYGDMSRLVVGWLARTEPNEIIRTYNQLGWGGTANGRALHEVAKQWLRKYHSERYERLPGIEESA